MTYTPSVGTWPQPPQQIRNWQEAELNAARWMRHWGYGDAEVTPTGPDGGVDVRSAHAVAQVKHLAVTVGRPDVQRFLGAAAAEPGKRLMFFSLSDYAAAAVEFADRTDVALFQYAADGSVTPVNTAARLAMGAPARPAGAQRLLTSMSQPRNARQWDWLKGLWYFPVTILPFGLFTAIPFWHAQAKLRRPSLRLTAIAYTAADVAMFVLLGAAPKNTQGDAAGALGNILTGIAVVLGLLVMVTGCIQLRRLRREIYFPAGTASSDPAVGRILAERKRREDARRLMAKDPTMGRELGIGRPDLGRGYDDGGLVDLNTAPAEVIAGVGGLDRARADQVIAARNERGGVFYSIGEVFMDVDLPPAVQDQLRERAVF